MNKHFSDEQLLNEQFNLNNPAVSAGIQKHLAECGECARRAREQAGRFSALDALKEERPEVSEPQIADILRAVRKQKSAPRSYALWTRVLWIAAPVTVAGLLLMLIVPMQSGLTPRTSETMTAQKAEPMIEPTVVRLARSVRAAAETASKQPLLGAASVMVIARDLPVSSIRHRAVNDDEVEEIQANRPVMLAMKSMPAPAVWSRKELSVAGNASVGADRKSNTAPRDQRVMEMDKVSEAEMKIVAADVAMTPAPRQEAGYIEIPRRDLSDVKKVPSADIEVPMASSGGVNGKKETWESMNQERPVLIVSTPMEGVTGAENSAPAWQVVAQNRSDGMIEVRISRMLLKPGWSAEVKDPDVKVQAGDQNEICFVLNVPPRATKTFIYELHPAVPASGGAVRNAEKKESEE